MPQANPSSNICWSAVKGIGATISKSGVSAFRTRSTTPRWLSSEPVPTATRAKPSRKWCSAGTKGSGGADMATTWKLTSGGRSGMTSRATRRASAAWSMP